MLVILFNAVTHNQQIFRNNRSSSHLGIDHLRMGKTDLEPILDSWASSKLQRHHQRINWRVPPRFRHQGSRRVHGRTQRQWTTGTVYHHRYRTTPQGQLRHTKHRNQGTQSRVQALPRPHHRWRCLFLGIRRSSGCCWGSKRSSCSHPCGIIRKPCSGECGCSSRFFSCPLRPGSPLRMGQRSRWSAGMAATLSHSCRC